MLLVFILLFTYLNKKNNWKKKYLTYILNNDANFYDPLLMNPVDYFSHFNKYSNKQKVLSSEDSDNESIIEMIL